MYSVNLMLDKRTKNKDGEHPIKLVINHSGKQNVCSTKCFITEEEYDELPISKKHVLKDFYKELMQIKIEADAIIKDLGTGYTWERFKRKFYSGINHATKGSQLSITELYEEYIAELERHHQYKNAQGYKSSLTSLKKFVGRDFYLQEVTEDFLKRYESWVLHGGINPDKKELSISTVRTYLRPLRAIYYNAIERGKISAEANPFGRKRFPIGNSTSARAALYPDEITSFWNFVPENPAQQRAKDYWFFAYLGFGMAPIDIANLTFKNIYSDRIDFSRNKTRKSAGENIRVLVPLEDALKDIIRRQGNANPNPYIFPILTSKMKKDEKYEAIEAWKNAMNKILRRIGKKLNTHVSINLYAARHSFADKLGEKDYNLKTIADMLGNTTVTMAMNYIGNTRFEKSKEVANHFLEFRNK